MYDPKSIWVSKTFWFNALSLLSALIVTLTPLLEKDQLLIALKFLAYANAIINVLLRFLTKQPVEIKMPD